MAGWLRQSLTIGRVHTTRQHRRLRSQPILYLFQFVPVLFGLVGVVGRLPIPGYSRFWSAPGAFVYGTRFAAGEPFPALSTARGFAGLLFVLLVYIVLLQEAGGDSPTVGDVDHLLLTVPPRTIAVGNLLAYGLFNGPLVGAILLAGSVAFGVGAGSAFATACLLLASVPLLATAVSVAYVVALAAQLAFLRFERLRENKLLLGGPLVAAVAGLFVRFRTSTELLSTLPLGWFADVGFALLTPDASPTNAAAAVLASAGLVGASVVVAARLGERLWLADDPVPPAQSAHLDGVVGDSTAERRERTGVDRLLSRVASRSAAAAIRVTWLRVLRRPRALLFTAALLGITSSVGFAVGDLFPDAVPLVVALYGAATVGVGVTLNPLGNEGPALPVTLTTPAGGRNVLVGYALSAALPGGVLVGLATLLAGAATTLDSRVQLGLAGLGGVLGVAAAFVSLGIGVALPQFDGVSPTGGGGLQTPRLEAVTVLVLTIVALGMPALAGLYGATGVAALVGVPSVAVVAGGVVTTALAAALAAWLSYRRALSAVAGYEFE